MACKSNRNKSPEIKAEKVDTNRFFQVTQYIQTQIAEVNKTPYYIYKIDITNGKKDSAAINTAIFNQLSTAFLKPDINDNAIKKNYIESIFHDETTKSFTISYSTLDKKLQIQDVQILLKEDGETVKRIFMRKYFNYTDSSAIEQLSWKPEESFQINRIVQKPGNSESTYETTVVWNEKN